MDDHTLRWHEETIWRDMLYLAMPLLLLPLLSRKAELLDSMVVIVAAVTVLTGLLLSVFLVVRVVSRKEFSADVAFREVPQ